MQWYWHICVQEPHCISSRNNKDSLLHGSSICTKIGIVELCLCHLKAHWTGGHSIYCVTQNTTVFPSLLPSHICLSVHMVWSPKWQPRCMLLVLLYELHRPFSHVYLLCFQGQWGKVSQQSFWHHHSTTDHSDVHGNLSQHFRLCFQASQWYEMWVSWWLALFWDVHVCILCTAFCKLFLWTVP